MLEPSLSTSLSKLKAEFLVQQALPEEYWNTAQQWFIPLGDKLVAFQKDKGRPILVGINGAQGSGKSTLAAFLVAYFEEVYQVESICFSIDDFYLSKSKRVSLSNAVHPLLITRGVPGTHDMDLLDTTLSNLLAGNSCKIPQFDKSVDDLFPKNQWPQISNQNEIIILEGWCVGTTPQTKSQLATPINQLEANSDRDASWREFVNKQLQDSYANVFNRLDTLIFLQAPSFKCVSSWRIEQEHKLKARLRDKTIGMDDSKIYSFIQYFQRLTEHNLNDLPNQSDYVFKLDERRQIVAKVER